MKKSDYTFISVLLIALFIFLTYNPSSEARDIVILVDNSGSMKTQGYDETRRIPASIKDFIEQLQLKHPDEDRVALIKFHEWPEVLIPLMKTGDILDIQRFDLSNVLSEKLDYTGKWTIFKPALKKAYETLNLGETSKQDESYVILISDGIPDQRGKVNERRRKTMADKTDSMEFIANYMKPSGVTLYTIPFSKNADTRLMQYFADDGARGSDMLPKTVRAEKIYTLLKSQFIYDCREFPPNEEVEFNLGIVSESEEELFSDLYKGILQSLPRAYRNVNFRKVLMNRIEVGNLEWAWEENFDSRRLAGLMRDIRLHGLLLLYSPGSRSFNFRLVSCHKSGYELKVFTNRSVGVEKELVRQFLEKYPKMEEDIVSQMVPVDPEAITFHVTIDGKGNNFHNLTGLYAGISVFNNGMDVTERMFRDFDLKTLGAIDEQGYVTFYIPKRAGYKISVWPEDKSPCHESGMECSRENMIDEALTEKSFQGGWRTAPQVINIPIPIDEKNFPEEELFTYIRSGIDASKETVIEGNVRAEVIFRPKNQEGEQGEYRLKVGKAREVIPAGSLLRGTTYEVEAIMEDPIPDGLVKTITLNGASVNKYIQRYEGTRVFGRTGVIAIPFYLNLPSIIHKKALDSVNPVEIDRYQKLALDFFDPEQSDDPERFPYEEIFEKSRCSDIFDMTNALHKKIVLKDDRIVLWGSLLKTGLSCLPSDNYPELSNKIEIFAVAHIVKKLISNDPNQRRKHRRFLNIAEEKAHILENEDFFQDIKELGMSLVEEVK